jgi:ABC-2 type transport system permease protein
MQRLHTLIVLELKLLLHSRAVVASLVLMLGAGVFGLVHGHTVIERQRATLAQAAALQDEQHRAILAPVQPTARAADQLYYLFFHTRHEPSPWAPFSIGLRDIQPYNLKVRLLALHGQLYTGDLVNPLLAAFGHFDAAFVLAWLSPLVVIALVYGVWSEEREQGTWDLVRAQPSSAFGLLTLKLAVRALLVLVPLLGVIAGATMWWALPLDAHLLHVVVLTFLYVGVWFGLATCVIGLGRSSQVNALALLGVWVLTAVLAPTLVTVAAALWHPLPEALELTVRQRQGYHASWDRDLSDTMAQFYRRYPAYTGAAVPRDTYSNAWYYAMQQAGDDAAEPAVHAYFDALEQRRAWSARAALLLPPAALQLGLNRVARTDLDHHVGYLRSVMAYHESLKRHFLPAIFDNRPVSSVDWQAAPQHVYHAPDASVVPPMIALAMAAGLLVGVGLWQLRERVRKG